MTRWLFKWCIFLYICSWFSWLLFMFFNWHLVDIGSLILKHQNVSNLFQHTSRKEGKTWNFVHNSLAVLIFFSIFAHLLSSFALLLTHGTYSFLSRNAFPLPPPILTHLPFGHHRDRLAPLVVLLLTANKHLKFNSLPVVQRVPCFVSLRVLRCN